MDISEHISIFIQEMERRGYSKNSIKNYSSNVALFFSKSIADHPKNINEGEIRKYLFRFKENNTQRNHHSAIKLFYEICMRQKHKFQFIPYCAKSNYLPVILSQNEIQRIFDVIENLKHRTILAVMYSTGVRISELLNIRLKDIDRNNMVIYITDGKGSKPRQVTLKIEVLQLIEKYWLQYRTKEFLFEGQTKRKYSARSINEFLKTYSEKAGITKKVHAHLIRHCTGTHLTEAGVQLGIIQRSFGHSSPNTTAIYQHISPNIISSMYSPINSIRL